MNISELIGIKNVAQAQPAYDPNEPSDQPRDFWMHRLADAGFKHLGAGMYGDVWEKPGLPYVLKVFSSQDHSYQVWVNLCVTHRGNPHLPRFVGGKKTIRLTPDILAVRMEKLEPLGDNDRYLLRVVRQTEKLIDDRRIASIDELLKDSGDPAFKELKSYIQKYPGYLTVMNMIKNIMKSQGGIFADTHADNFMLRPDGVTLVFTDPLGSLHG
jgi:hypothetical protein